MTAPNLGITLAILAIASVGATSFGDDPFPRGSVWTGNLTQDGRHPDFKSVPSGYEVVMVVTGRNGDSFTADLHERVGGIRLTYKVEGQLQARDGGRGVKLRFRPVEAEGSKSAYEAHTELLYATVLRDDQIIGLWRHRRNERNITVHGTLTLKRDHELERHPAADSKDIPRSGIYRPSWILNRSVRSTRKRGAW